MLSDDEIDIVVDAPRLLTTTKPNSGSAEGCDQGNASALLPWEQVLIADFADNVSSWGHLCFDTTQGASDAYAQVSSHTQQLLPPALASPHLARVCGQLHGGSCPLAVCPLPLTVHGGCPMRHALHGDCPLPSALSPARCTLPGREARDPMHSCMSV